MLESDSDRLAYVMALGDEVAVNYTSVYGVFERLYSEAFDSGGYSPTLTVRTIDVPSVAQGDPVIVDGVAYVISNVEPDGLGMTVLRLEAA